MIDGNTASILRACIRWWAAEEKLKSRTQAYRGHMRCVESDQHDGEGNPVGYQAPAECSGPEAACEYHGHDPAACVWCADESGAESKSLKRAYRSMSNSRNRARRKLLLLVDDHAGWIVSTIGG